MRPRRRRDWKPNRSFSPTRRRGGGTPALVLSGLVMLVLGFAGFGAANFVADQFTRAAWLGWATLAVVVAGFALLGAGIWRELRALLALGRVERLRAALASGEARRVMEAARVWAAQSPGGPGLLPALREVNDPDAAIALLRAGPGRALREAADAQSRAAAVQTVAGLAALPSPALDVLLVAWRGTRLVRQVASLYGVRPGILGTVSLLRRTALSATMVGAAELAGNTVAHGLLSNPLLGTRIRRKLQAPVSRHGGWWCSAGRQRSPVIRCRPARLADEMSYFGGGAFRASAMPSWSGAEPASLSVPSIDAPGSNASVFLSPFSRRICSFSSNPSAPIGSCFSVSFVIKRSSLPAGDGPGPAVR